MYTDGQAFIVPVGMLTGMSKGIGTTQQRILAELTAGPIAAGWTSQGWSSELAVPTGRFAPLSGRWKVAAWWSSRENIWAGKD